MAPGPPFLQGRKIREGSIWRILLWVEFVSPLFEKNYPKLSYGSVLSISVQKLLKCVCMHMYAASNDTNINTTPHMPHNIDTGITFGKELNSSSFNKEWADTRVFWFSYQVTSAVLPVACKNTSGSNPMVQRFSFTGSLCFRKPQKSTTDLGP